MSVSSKVSKYDKHVFITTLLECEVSTNCGILCTRIIAVIKKGKNGKAAYGC